MTLPPLNPQALFVGLVFPPKKLDREPLNELFLAVSRRFPEYNIFGPIAGYGIRIADQVNNEILLDENRVQIKEVVGSMVSSKEKCVILLKDILLPRIQSIPFLLFNVKMICNVSLGHQNAALDFLNQKVLSVGESTLGVLGPGPDVKGIGTRFVLVRNAPDKTIFELKVESLISDPSKLFIDLDVQFLDAFHAPEAIASRIDSAHGFLKDQVKNFLVTAGVETS